MGRLKSRAWIQEDKMKGSQSGEFYREEVKFRGTIEEGGKYPPETGRYHLYISLACPWACRAYIQDNGWTFKEDFPGFIPDTNDFYPEVLRSEIDQINSNQIVPKGLEVLVSKIKIEKENAEPVKNVMPKQESVFDEAGVS